jgi:hypothetical protein
MILFLYYYNVIDLKEMAAAVIEIRKSGILHQVKLRAYVAGEAAKEGATARLATQSQPGDDNDDIINPFIENGHSRIVDVLTGIYEKSNCFFGDYIDDCGCRECVFTYELDVPRNFDGTQLNSLMRGIEEYLVNYALCEWYRLTWPDKAALYLQNMEEELRKIKHRSYQRTSPVRRGLNPF